MNELLTGSVFFGAVLSLLTYEAGLLIKKKCKGALFNPLLIAMVLTIVILLVFRIDFDTYNNGAKYISYLLTPTTVCLAIPLYEQFSLLKKNVRAVMIGILSGVITSLTFILLLSVLFGFSHVEYVTFLPKSITTAIGMGVSEILGGYVSITVGSICVTGLFGNIIAETLCRVLHITDPVAKGVATGTSSHAIGTAKAMEMGELEGAISGLSIVVAGILTVLAAPVFALFY